MPLLIAAEIEQRIREIIVEKGMLDVPVERLQMDTPLNEGDMELDSVQTLEVLVGLEEEFDFFFDDDDITPELFGKVGNLVEYVKMKAIEEKSEVMLSPQPTVIS